MRKTLTTRKDPKGQIKTNTILGPTFYPRDKK
jgi:hypothetical protein